MNGSNFRFFFLPCRYIPWRWSDCYRERKRLPFPFNSQWECEQTCYSHYMHLVIIDFFRVLESFPGPRLPMLTFQVRISFLGSQDTALLFLSLSMQDLQISKLSHFSRLSFGHHTWIHSVWRFISWETILYAAWKKLLDWPKSSFKHFHNVTFGQLNVS